MTHDLSEYNMKKSVCQLVEFMHLQEEEERQVRATKQRMEEEIEMRMEELNELEMEKTKLEGEIMSLKVRDTAYQSEHLNLRNAIAITKFKIEKIKESIENIKKRELEDLREFERNVDEITEKFRSSPAIYDRRALSEKLEKEKERRELLLENIRETRESYANFNRVKGLRERSNEEEELLNCVLPGSELYSLMEMTKNLDQVIRFMRHRTKNLKEKEVELEDLTANLKELATKMADVTVE